MKSDSDDNEAVKKSLLAFLIKKKLMPAASVISGSEDAAASAL